MATAHATDPVGIAIFAKAPVPGYAKTRLIPRLGLDGAAALQRGLIERTLATALDAATGPVSLWCAPDRRHPLFQHLAEAHGIALHDQPDADLGARMLSAFEALPAPLLLVGTDCPPLTAGHLRHCAARLAAGDDAVFLPAEDGGYVLVGLARPRPEPFAGMAWGTGTVMAETRARLVAAGMTWSEPALLWDLDRPEDYDRLLAFAPPAASPP